MHLRTLTTRAFRFGAVLAAAGATTVAPATALAGEASGPVGTPRPLAVSVPAEAAQLTPGATGTIPIRVVNPGPKPVTARITSQQVTFGDDGRVTVDGHDALWEHRVGFPTEPITVPAEGYREVALAVHMPARLSPDLYFVGFLVTPVPDAAGNLTFINQIGSYLTIDVPGPRTRSLAADLQLPGFAFTSHPVLGNLHLRNTGHTAAAYWFESDTSATPGSSTPMQERHDRSLLPAGRARVVVVSARPSFPIAVATVRVHVFYPGRTDAETTEIVLTKRVLVVQPLALIILAGGLIAAALVYVRRRRKRRPPSTRRRRARRAAAVERTTGPRSARSARRRVSARVNATARLDRALEQARGAQPG